MPTVAIGVQALQVTDREFDFQITVSDNDCSDVTNCLGTPSLVNANTAKGLQCDAYVASSSTDTSCTYATSSDYLPCKKWTNFYDSTKGDDYKFTLTMTDASNELVTGTYQIKYECYWLMADGVTKAPDTTTGEQTLHEFVVEEGCSDWLSLSTVPVGKSFLLSSPDFLSITDCDTVDYVKEMVFRKYDTNPRDGKLSYDEIQDAFLRHDADFSHLTNEIGESGYSDLTLSDIMNSDALPFNCYEKAVTGSSDVYMTSITYPDSCTDADSTSTTLNSCAAAKELVTVKWAYNTPPVDNSDYMCVYSDARLFAKYVGSDTGGIPTSLTDSRPSMGTGDSEVSLIAHFLFDDDMSNSASADDTTTTLTGYDSFETCGDGVKCLKMSTSSSGYEFANTNEMANSAIMTWIYRSSSDTGNADVIYSTSVTGSSCKKEIHFTLGIDATLSGGLVISDNSNGGCTQTCGDGDGLCEISSATALSTNSWHHVAMVSNNIYGLTIYENGVSAATMVPGDWTNTLMDLPFGMTSTTKTLFNSDYASSSYVYDDARIYSGFVHKLHISSIYNCGRSELCANRAYASPQSRRIYCVVLNYAVATQGTSGFTHPCVTGLFYNGLAIDLTTSVSTKGVTFQFRDTALGESSFEVLRRQVVDGSAVGTYESIVLIDSDISGCASSFNSMTFADYEAAKIPGDVWEYAIRTKYPTDSVLNIDSDAFTFTVPWYGVVEGEILAGESDVAVPNVRVCSRLKSSTTSSDTSVGTVSDAESPSLASYTYVVHSNSDRISDAYKVTDTQTGTSVELDNAEHLKIDLNIFSSVSSVSVCVASTTDLTTAPEFIVRVMDYDDPDDAGNSGNMCIEDEISSVVDGNVCIKYSCVGTHISSFSGQYITVLSGESSTQSIAEVFVTGSEITCPYSGFSDDDGNFEIEITEESGATSKNAKVGVMAFKTVVFDRSDSTLFQTVANETDTSIVGPDAVLVTLEYTGSAVFEASLLGKNEKVASLGYDANTMMFEYLPSSISGTTIKDTSSSDVSIGDAYMSPWGCFSGSTTSAFKSTCNKKVYTSYVIQTPKVDLRTFDGFTFEMYAKFTSRTDNQWLFGHGKTSTTSQGLYIGVAGVHGLMFGIYNDDLSSGWFPELDTWYHLVFTYENSGSYTKSIYVDGELKATGPGSAYAYSGFYTQLLIGRNYGL